MIAEVADLVLGPGLRIDDVKRAPIGIPPPAADFGVILLAPQPLVIVFEVCRWSSAMAFKARLGICFDRILSCCAAEFAMPLC